MARMRYLKPEFWTDSKVVQVSAFARLLFMGMWNFAECDNGHLDDDPVALKLKILPNDAGVDVIRLVDELLEGGLVTRDTTPSGRVFLHVRGLPKHQKVDPRWAPRCSICTELAPDAPPKTSPKLSDTPQHSPENPDPHRKSLQEGIGGEGIGDKKTLSRAKARDMRKGSRIPEDFTVSDDMKTWARQKTPHVIDGYAETEKFIDYWRGESGARAVKRDWVAAWRTWMRNAEERASRSNGRSPELSIVHGSYTPPEPPPHIRDDPDPQVYRDWYVEQVANHRRSQQ